MPIFFAPSIPVPFFEIPFIEQPSVVRGLFYMFDMNREPIFIEAANV